MKKLLCVLLAIVLVMAVFVPAASARGGGFSGGGGGWRGGGGGWHGGGWRGGGWHGGGWGWRGGCWGCGFGWGVFTGAVLGSALAWPFYYPAYPYSYYPPYPYYGAPAYYGAPPAYGAPQSSCYTQQGYWQQAPVSDGGGFTTYQNVWVPPQTVCR